MDKLKISNETRHHHLVDFCGNSLISSTGQTWVITPYGKVLLEMGDEIKKHHDGKTFTVDKARNNP
jgi:hypothetical protein